MIRKYAPKELFIDGTRKCIQELSKVTAGNSLRFKRIQCLRLALYGNGALSYLYNLYSFAHTKLRSAKIIHKNNNEQNIFKYEQEKNMITRYH